MEKREEERGGISSTTFHILPFLLDSHLGVFHWVHPLLWTHTGEGMEGVLHIQENQTQEEGKPSVGREHCRKLIRLHIKRSLNIINQSRSHQIISGDVPIYEPVRLLLMLLLMPWILHS